MPFPPRYPRPPRAALRGFTLVEMLAVLAMISILALAASPVFIGMMRDRRVNRAAFQLVDMVRTARMRAVGRNLPVQLTWNANGGAQILSAGLLTMNEPVVSVFAASRSCLGTYAVPVPPPVQEVSRFDLGNGSFEHAVVQFVDNTGAVRPQVSLCFSGRGATYMILGAFAARLAGPVSFTVANFNAATNITGLQRRVLVPPNGAARLAQ